MPVYLHLPKIWEPLAVAPISSNPYLHLTLFIKKILWYWHFLSISKSLEIICVWIRSSEDTETFSEKNKWFKNKKYPPESGKGSKGVKMG